MYESTCILAALMCIIQQIICYEPSVIIVGAGAAGIAAASRLLQSNITDIKIIEAEERIGGRIYSIQFGDSTLDLGAEWCHGEINNVVYDLIKDYDLVEKTDTSHVFYHSRNDPVITSLVNDLYNIFFSLYGNKQNYGQISLDEYIVTKYNEVINERYSYDKRKFKFASEFLNFIKNKLLITTGALSLNNVAANSDYVETEGNKTLNWKGKGHKMILDVLLKRYPNPSEQLSLQGKLFLSKRVRDIFWNEREKIRVKCDDESEFSADYVIWTPSLGVLKAEHERIFKPFLPRSKVEAIDNLGIGAVAKVFLYYPVKWWPDEVFENFNLIWEEEDQLRVAEEFPFGPVHHGKSWLVSLIGFQAVTKHPNILLVWFIGELVPEIELLPEQTIIDGTHFVLNKFLGHKFPNISKPNYIYRNDWYNNPNFRGTYSYQSVLSDRGENSDEIILSHPLTSSNGKTTLLFAGEATSDIYYATVHGAIGSGFREAERLIRLYKSRTLNC